jgi:hypothetical protein
MRAMSVVISRRMTPTKMALAAAGILNGGKIVVMQYIGVCVKILYSDSLWIKHLTFVRKAESIK